MAAEPPRAKPPGRRLYSLDPANFLLSLIFAILVLAVLVLLVQQIQRFRNRRAGITYIHQVEKEFTQQLTQDLFMADLHRGSCWRPPIMVEASGRALRLRSSHPEHVTTLTRPAKTLEGWLHLANLVGLRTDMKIRICYQNRAEELLIKKIKEKEEEGDESSDRMITIGNLRTGINALENSYPVGATVSRLDEVLYSFANSRLTRRPSRGMARVIPAVSDFVVKLLPGAESTYEIHYTLQDEVSGLAKEQLLTWIPWSDNPALTAKQVSEHYGITNKSP